MNCPLRNNIFKKNELSIFCGRRIHCCLCTGQCIYFHTCTKRFKIFYTKVVALGLEILLLACGWKRKQESNELCGNLYADHFFTCMGFPFLVWKYTHLCFST